MIMGAGASDEEVARMSGTMLTGDGLRLARAIVPGLATDVREDRSSRIDEPSSAPRQTVGVRDGKERS